MADQKIVCATCHNEFVYTESEKQYLEGLVREKKLPELREPRRCLPCRTKSRKDGVRAAQGHKPYALAPKSPPATPFVARPLPSQLRAPVFSGPLPIDAPPPPAPVVAPSSAPTPAIPPEPGPAQPSKIPIGPSIREIEDGHYILVAGDFERLVCREDVVLRHQGRKVTLRLADIGLPAMKAAMEKAVLQWWKS